MIRLLLTLLALMSGLAAQVSPASARVLTGAEAQVQLVSVASRRAEAGDGQSAVPRELPAMPRAILPAIIPVAPAIPATEIGIDRSRQ